MQDGFGCANTIPGSPPTSKAWEPAFVTVDEEAGNRHTGRMKSFADIGVFSRITEKLAERSIIEPTEVQASVIPLLSAGRDLAFRSATGTGKTFAYLVPVLQGIEDARASGSFGRGPLAVICAPTFELCAQIKGEAEFLGAAFDPRVKVALLTGDANIARQIDKLKADKPQIVVGAPGRLVQLEKMGKLVLERVRWLVLDEADRLVSDEMIDLTRTFVDRLPPERVTAACSATLTPRSRVRFAPFLRGDALSEDIDDAVMLKTMIEHWAFFSEGRRKIATLRSFLFAAKGAKTLVFSDRGGQVENIYSQLRHHGIAVSALFGDMDKVERKKSMDDFRAGRSDVLVTSDLAARGLDVPDLTHVVQMDVPETPEGYAHRAGRTARAGRKGVMATIGDEIELPRLASLEKKLGIVIYPKVLFGGVIRAPDPIEDGEAEEADVREGHPPRLPLRGGHPRVGHPSGGHLSGGHPSGGSHPRGGGRRG